MTLIRRILHVVAWVGTALVAIVALALIASQTPWFRDWVRRTIVRETKQYLNGELTIGGLSGNFFFGVSLSDVAVDVSGDRVVAVKRLDVDYSVFTIVSQGILVDRIALTAPSVHMVRDASGWNLGRLVKSQRQEADREGPQRSISLPSISIIDGSVSIDDAVGSTVYQLPQRINDLDLKAAFAYEPVHYSIVLDHLSLQGADPDILLQQLTGKIAVRDDSLFLEKLVVKTGESTLDIDGVIEQYLRTPVIKLVTRGTASLPEIGRILKPVAGYEMHPTFTLKTNGPLDRFAMDIDMTSEAGLARGQVTADFRAPDLRFAGPLHLERFNLAPIVRNPAQRTRITGDTTFDIAIASDPANASVIERLNGTFKFKGPEVVAFGYAAGQVSTNGSIKGPRIELGETTARAYGASATARGAIVLPESKRAIAYELEGTADGVDLRRLPRALRVPQLDTNLSLSAYSIRGSGSTASGSATLRPSEIEGATITDGTVGEFEVGRNRVAYGARGGIENLNLPRLGRALEIDALDNPLYDGRVNGTFDVTGSGTAIDALELTATGTLRDSAVAGTYLPEMAFDARIADATLAVKAKGAFRHLNPAVLSGRKAIDGNVNGSVDGTLTVENLAADITPAAFGFDGQVALDPSLVGGVQIEGADVIGRFANEVADLTRLHVTGPDVIVDASGRLALNRTSASNLTYHVDATDIADVGRLAGQSDLSGSVVLDGNVAGNAESLRTTGTMVGSALAFQNNRVLSVESKFDVTMPEFDFVRAVIRADTRATFVEAAGMQLNEATATTAYADKRLEFKTRLQEQTRELEASGDVVFHPDHQEIHLPDLALRTQGIEWRMMPGGDPRVRYGPGQIVVNDIRLASGGQTLEISGTLPQKEGPDAGTLQVNATNVDLAQLEQLLMQDRGLSGRLTVAATVAGSMSNPAVDGRVEITDGGFQGYKYESLVADVDYTSNQIDLDLTLTQAPGVAITAIGVVPRTIFEPREGHVEPSEGDTVDLHIQTPALNLGVVQGFTTAVTNVAGTVQADVRIVGSGHDPHLTGFVEIRDAAFAVPRAGTSYSGLDTRIDLEPEQVRIRRFEILDENGEQLAVAGQLAVHERAIGAVDVTIESQNFEAIDNELGDLGIGTNLRITGQVRQPRLEGDIRIAAGRLEVDRILQLFYDPYSTQELPDVVSADTAVQASGSAEQATQLALADAAGRPEIEPGQTPAPASQEGAGGAFESLSMDVRIRIPDNMVLRGRRLRPGGPTAASLGDINITVGGDLTVRKDQGRPTNITGTVRMVRGTYTFQGRQFDIARDGTVRFAGDTNNPIIDITAVREIPDTGVEARIRLTGTLTAPQLALTSTPPLDESDILALIVFNRPLNDLGTGERASLAATAGGIATGFIATPLGESIGRALDLDLFEITTSAEGDSLGAGITVGEQVGDRTFVKLRQQFGDRTYTEFLLEYQITDYLRFTAQGAPETSGAANRIGQRRIERAGVDLLFLFSY
jgi:translocation and assembly module TamB